MVILAQVLPTDLAGGSGWAGAGLLGLVLAWLLLRHLPEKDRMLSDIIEKHDTVEREQRKEYLTSLKEERNELRAMFNSLPRCRYSLQMVDSEEG